MFCPVCRSEYVDGIARCTDCGVGLTEALPPQRESRSVWNILFGGSVPPADTHGDLVEVYHAFTSTDTDILRSLLERGGIPVHVLRDPMASDEARMMVARADAARARALISLATDDATPEEDDGASGA